MASVDVLEGIAPDLYRACRAYKKAVARVKKAQGEIGKIRLHKENASKSHKARAYNWRRRYDTAHAALHRAEYYLKAAVEGLEI